MSSASAGTPRPQAGDTAASQPNGQELPFWHVMFENLDVQSSRGR